ncbi:GNAT family N-acetyltransferase [Microbacterium protaetiae]|uniref:GNAT family N-acetyltransferase n=1 Tax=Microbacterium protaetiae TaxID=2509458 RepID=A0A4P6EIN3_9MICO|nr:GNAT family N-acetyltransferase [Microbacterium protaetiae]QAY61129.1 GNAT family N-acetyltransferase [Microbacterium protaetiae]
MPDTTDITAPYASELPDGVELRRLVIPQSLDAADAADFVAMVRARNEIYREINGNDDESNTPAEILPRYQDEIYERNLLWIVLREGEVVGRAILTLPREDGSRVAFLNVELVRSAWGRGIGTAAAELLEKTARDEGRTVLQAWAVHDEDATAERLGAPTGFGTIALDHTARFLRAHGYSLEQIERKSALPLTDASYARVDELIAEARRASEGYRIVQWTVPTPADVIDAYAWMKSRMVTDAPAAGIEFDEEVWDAARVADHERPYLESERTLHVTAARHIASGELVAFNELVIGADRTEPTHQEDTLVLAEHRGHRLGMLVKCAALHDWRTFAPQSPRVITYNAEENRPMLDINEAIGFVPVAYNGAWKKTVR